MTVEERKKIRTTIRRYERSMRKEQTERGFIDDGYGKRYLLGPMYLQLGDLEGALESFEWCRRTFPDDVGEPFQYLCWALALFRAGEFDAAQKKLLQTILMNLYLVPHLLSIDVLRLDIWHSSNMEDPTYVEYLPEEYVELWDKDALAWAQSVYEDAEVQKILKKSIDVRSKLKDEPPGPVRTQLVLELAHLENADPT